MDVNPDLKSWCENVAALSVDILVDFKLVKAEDFERAKAIIAEEILVRLSMRDYPPTEKQP
jgi:hypothetical protein